MARYSKFVVAVVGAAIAIISRRYGSSAWVQDVIMVATALGVYGVKNES